MSAVAVAVVAIVVVRRSRPRPVVHEKAPEKAPEARWPPAPILGVPTAGDRELFAARPETVFDRPGFVRFFAPGEPLDRAVRRQLTRWAAVAAVFVLLGAGTQVLESAVFSHEDKARTATVAVMPVEVPEPVRTIPDADCHPEYEEPRVRKIDPRVTRAVNRQWTRIERWLSAHAPRTYRTLGRPGRATTIAVAEAQMGLRFPDDLRASLLRHNGSAYTARAVPFGFLDSPSMSVREIRDTWRSLCGTDDQEEPGQGDERAGWWDGRMIPFGADGLGDALVVDSVRRDVGETDNEGGMSFEPGGVRIRSFHALLKATADALEKRGSVGFWHPRATSGELEWQTG
ncbi:MAG: hypothetical protein HOY71_35100 [Nonomuraea sp.]|nr:hypothetical protein [Nonomuraea sp.]